MINTARGELCEANAIAAALESGGLAGYAGGVWSPQARYATGTREILECYFEDRAIRNEYLTVQGGKLAGVGAHSYTAGNATLGSKDAAKFKGA